MFTVGLLVACNFSQTIRSINSHCFGSVLHIQIIELYRFHSLFSCKCHIDYMFEHLIKEVFIRWLLKIFHTQFSVMGASTIYPCKLHNMRHSTSSLFCHRSYCNALFFKCFTPTIFIIRASVQRHLWFFKVLMNLRMKKKNDLFIWCTFSDNGNIFCDHPVYYTVTVNLIELL